MRDEGLLMKEPLPEEERDEATLRPRHMEDFIGQAELKHLL